MMDNKKGDKTEAARQRKKKKKNQLVLPPCRVCGGNATGIHYGVNTCQGCKAFFQRYQKRKEPYVCSRNRDCDIVARKRGICSACRMEKCTRLGMSKRGIRLGRYTLTERTETIKEVKNIRVNGSHKTNTAKNNPSSRSQRLFKLFSDKFKTIEKQQIDTFCSCSSLEDDGWTTPLMEYACASPNTDSDSEDSMDTVGQLDSMFNQTFDDNLDTNSPCVQDVLFDLNAPISPQTVSTYLQTAENDLYTNFDDEESIRDMHLKTDNQQYIEELTDLYSKMVVASDMSTENIKGMLKLKYEKYKEKTQIFGEMKALSMEEFRSIHQLTGLDVDGRLELVSKLAVLEKESKRQRLNFARKIPDFTSLHEEDQNSLITTSAFECELLCCFRGVDTELGMVLLKTGDVFHIDQLSGMFESTEKCMMNLKMCKLIQDLDLTNQELALCFAITQTFQDRRRLRNPDKVEKIQLDLVSKLQTILQQRLPDKSTFTFTKIVDMLSNLRVFTEETRKSFRKLYQDEFTRQICPYVPAICLIEY